MAANAKRVLLGKRAGAQAWQRAAQRMKTKGQTGPALICTPTWAACVAGMTWAIHPITDLPQAYKAMTTGEMIKATMKLMRQTKIDTTPEMKAWNAAVERADAVLFGRRGAPAPEMDEMKLFNALCSNGLYQTAETLLRAGEAVGYFQNHKTPYLRETQK